MEKVLDSMKRGCVIERSGLGLYDLTLTEDGREMERVRNVLLKSAARIASDWLGGGDDDETN